MESQNPEIYRKCCTTKPPEQAQTDWEAFCQEVYELRVKHQIPDLCLVARMVLQYPEGEGQAMTIAHFGDELQAEPMTAWAFGHEQSQRQERIASLVLDASKMLRHGKNRR